MVLAIATTADMGLQAFLPLLISLTCTLASRCPRVSRSDSLSWQGFPCELPMGPPGVPPLIWRKDPEPSSHSPRGSLGQNGEQLTDCHSLGKLRHGEFCEDLGASRVSAHLCGLAVFIPSALSAKELWGHATVICWLR